MELRHLRYYVGVAEALSFRAAAENLHVSAPALSKQIKELEGELGVRLLDRDTQRVRLTPGGAVFLKEARLILAQVARAAELARATSKGRHGHLKIGTIGRTLAHFMPECLATFQARHPEVEIELIELDYDAQFAALAAGTLDIGFMPGHIPLPKKPKLHRETVLATPLLAVLGKRHRLAKARAVTLAELAQERLLVLEKIKTSVSVEYAHTLFNAHGLTPREVTEVKSFQGLLAMVAAGHGASLLGFESSVASAPGLVLRPLSDQGPHLELKFSAVYRDTEAGPLRQKFLGVLSEVMAK